MPLTFNSGNIRTVSGLCKIIETSLLLVAIMIQRITNTQFGQQDAHIFSMGLLVAGLIITPILLICYIVDKSITRSSLLEPVLNITLFGLLLIAAIICFVFWTRHYVPRDPNARSSGLALGCFVLFSSITYLVDGVFACRLYFRSN
nr:uncharacterized protein LOC123754135 [Procambarus clarkii]XP_045592292.1 uncharacterized protein LOC123754135 [Procambarus clarkii]